MAMLVLGWVVDVEERGTQNNAQQLRVALFESTFHFPGGMNFKHEINPQSPFDEMKLLETSEHMALDPFIFLWVYTILYSNRRVFYLFLILKQWLVDVSLVYTRQIP